MRTLSFDDRCMFERKPHTHGKTSWRIVKNESLHVWKSILGELMSRHEVLTKHPRRWSRATQLVWLLASALLGRFAEKMRNVWCEGIGDTLGFRNQIVMQL